MSTLHIRKKMENSYSEPSEGHYFLASVMKLFSIHRTISLLAQLYAFWSRIFPELSGEANPVTAMSEARHASQYLSTRRTPWVLEPCQTTFWGLKSNFVMLLFDGHHFVIYFGKRIGLSVVNQAKHHLDTPYSTCTQLACIAQSCPLLSWISAIAPEVPSSRVPFHFQTSHPSSFKA